MTTAPAKVFQHVSKENRHYVYLSTSSFNLLAYVLAWLGSWNAGGDQGMKTKHTHVRSDRKAELRWSEVADEQVIEPWKLSRLIT